MRNVQNLHDEDEWGMEKLNAYTFLRWFVTEADFEAPGDEVADAIRTVIWPNPVHFYEGGVRADSALAACCHLRMAAHHAPDCAPHTALALADACVLGAHAGR